MDDELIQDMSCSENINSDTINQALRSEAKGIFDEELKTDDSTKMSEAVEIADDADSKGASVADAQWFDEYGKKLLALTSPITWEYHKSEIDNVNNTINSIITIVKCVSFSTIALVAFFVLLDKDAGAIISAVSGGVIDLMLGVLVGLFNSTLKSKKSYFDAESDSSKFDKMLLLVQTVASQEKRDNVIVDMLRKHFEIPSNKKDKS